MMQFLITLHFTLLLNFHSVLISSLCSFHLLSPGSPPLRTSSDAILRFASLHSTSHILTPSSCFLPNGFFKFMHIFRHLFVLQHAVLLQSIHFLSTSSWRPFFRIHTIYNLSPRVPQFIPSNICCFLRSLVLR